MASLEMAAAGSGGFCVGTKFVVDHQRLSGLGYCFSASLPPMLAAASIKVIDILEEQGNELVVNLQETCKKAHKAFSKLSPKMELIGTPFCPVKHLRLLNHFEDRDEEENILRKIVAKAEENGVAIVVASYLPGESFKLPPPSIRFAINKDLSEEQISFAKTALINAISDVLDHK